MKNIEKVIVIGSGPSGWAASVYMSRARLNPFMISGEKSGGQLMLTTKVENYPGFPKGILGPELMINMRSQAERFGTRVIDKNVTKVDFSQRPFRVWVQDEEFQSHAVLISTGAESVMTSVPGEEQFLGRGVSTCAVCDAAFFKDKTTVVVGGGDSAMEDTLALTKFANSITILHRRDRFRASKIMQERVLNHKSVNILWNTTLKEIRGKDRVERVIIENIAEQTIQELLVDGVFIAIGHKPSSDIFRDQIGLNKKGYVITGFALEKQSIALAKSRLVHGKVPFPTMTLVDGVFAAGDVVDFMYRQASTAAGYGTMAALDIEHWLESQEL